MSWCNLDPIPFLIHVTCIVYLPIDLPYKNKSNVAIYIYICILWDRWNHRVFPNPFPTQTNPHLQTESRELWPDPQGSCPNFVSDTGQLGDHFRWSIFAWFREPRFVPLLLKNTIFSFIPCGFFSVGLWKCSKKNGHLRFGDLFSSETSTKRKKRFSKVFFKI